MLDIRDATFEAVHEYCKHNKDAVFITSDMGAWSLNKFREELPDQFINIGICEQTMIGVASGLALNGKTVIIYAIAPFLALRCLEHIKLDVCLMNLPIFIIGGGAGIAYASDGPTHHAVDDIAALNTLPNLTIYNPCTGEEAEQCTRAALALGTPVYLRLDKGGFPKLGGKLSDQGLNLVQDVGKVLVLTSGTITHDVQEALAVLDPDKRIFSLIHVARVKPLAFASLLPYLETASHLIIVDESLPSSGLGAIIPMYLIDQQITIKCLRIAMNETSSLYEYGDREWMKEHFSISKNKIQARISQFIEGASL
ncbi:putative 33.6 kDa protein in fasciation locus precursor [Marinomonas aquimarina]|uniref:Putative 33.6 kDa protein in fasciation locus n=1 Tax=Marinomonas aquimarina TaxID=295068 RepID=A0A1A8T2A2_9GAMM|nr:transketolase C-terminal domain-containing protein [Marinomonas aquimarina]SBS25422.1 putative 33.6 kDa protein in fasciation locus precursor [Marinomonas aquimarina]